MFFAYTLTDSFMKTTPDKGEGRRKEEAKG